MKNILRVSAISCAAFCLALAVAAPASARDDNSQLVKTAQIRLADQGYHVGSYDGIMGSVTENALMNFQRNNGLPVTGQLTPETYALLTHTSASLYPTYENYYRTASYNGMALNGMPVAWENTWHYVRDQKLPLRFANLNVREEDMGSARQYAITLNGHDVMFANNQPGVLRVSATYNLKDEDAVIFTAYQGDGACPNKSYLLVVHNDGSFNKPYEIGNCAGSYEAHVANNALIVSFPGANLVDGWQTWGTWRYKDDLMARI